MKIYICNAFSLSMLDRDEQTGTPAGYIPAFSDRILATARVPRPCTDPAAFLRCWERMADTEIVSAIGHADVAAIFSATLKASFPINRVTVKLSKDDVALIGQYIGPRLPEGVTTLPEGATIEWWTV